MPIVVSTLVLLIIGLGLVFRHRPRVHIPCMVSAFLLDISLVLFIELNRHAIETVSEGARQPFSNGLLLFHVSMSVVVLLLYGIQAWQGRGLLKGKEALRLRHRYLGCVFVGCRLLNYVTSFFIVT